MPARCRTSSPRRSTSATATGRSRRSRADLLDRRVEITGPVDRKMIINALNSGAKVFMADFEDANSPTWANLIEGQINLKDRWAGQDRLHRSDDRQGLQARRQAGRAARPAARLASARGASRRRRPADVGLAVRLRPLLLPQRQDRARRGQRPLFLPAEDGEPSRGAALERGLHPRRADARHPARHDQGDGADRDAARRLRDGRDHLRAPRPHGGAQLRPLGLHLLLHQDAPRTSRSSCCPTAARW